MSEAREALDDEHALLQTAGPRFALFALIVGLVGVVVFGLVLDVVPVAIGFAVVSAAGLVACFVDIAFVRRGQHRGEPG